MLQVVLELLVPLEDQGLKALQDLQEVLVSKDLKVMQGWLVILEVLDHLDQMDLQVNLDHRVRMVR